MAEEKVSVNIKTGDVSSPSCQNSRATIAYELAMRKFEKTVVEGIMDFQGRDTVQVKGLADVTERYCS